MNKIDLIKSYFHKVERPVFTGELSLFVGIPIDKCESFLESLESDGVIRRSGSTTQDIWVLTTKPSIKAAYVTV
jgi:hypothetical protein